MSKSFDLIVLGGGSGGIASAVRAASHGARVAVVEGRHLGGTCVNVGCVPKKVMFNASSLAEMMHKAPDYGFAPVPIEHDWGYLIEKRQEYIQRLREIYTKRLDGLAIEHVQGFGRFIDAKTVEVNGQSYRAEHIIIATGGKPVMPDYPGIEHGIDSDGFFELTQKPQKVAVVGSGYIGVELAGVLHHLGSETHLLIRHDTPLTRFDRMLGDTLLEVMQQQGIKVHQRSRATHLTCDDTGKKRIHCASGAMVEDLDAVIFAVGRNANTQDLGLERVGLKTGANGTIEVDAYQNTSVEGIYALGDVTLAPALTPVAIAAGRRLSDRLFGAKPGACLDYDSVCSVVFCHPPVGSVGLSEQAAIDLHGADNIKVYQTRFNPMLDALGKDKTPTVMKLITCGDEEKILGLHIIGYGADEMLQGFGVAIKMGATKHDFDNTVAIHPTSAEEVVTLV